MKKTVLGKVFVSSFLISLFCIFALGFQAAFASDVHYRVDFGKSTNKTTATGWNNIVIPYAGGDNALVDANGSVSPLKLQISDSFYYLSSQPTDYSVNPNGTTSNSSYPSSATGDSFFLGSLSGINDTTATIVIKGLTAGDTYDFKFFASRLVNDGSTRIGQYSIGNTTVELNAVNNVNNTAQILNVSPTNGTVTITINKKSGSVYAYLNLLDITEHQVTQTNQQPVANAGSDQSITTSDQLTLTGSGTDADGSIASYAWTEISGGAATIVTPASATTSITGFTTGTYVFRLTVTDDQGAMATDDVTVTIASPQTNQSPVANAGNNQVITLPVHTVTLSGTGTDADGSIVNYSWTELSSGLSRILSPTAASTLVTDLGPGTYTFQLTVTDNQGATANDTVTVLVNPEDTSSCSAQTIVVLGSSTAAGYGLNPISNSWVNRYTGYATGINAANSVPNLAVGGYTTYDVMPTGFIPPAGRPSPNTAHNITTALALHPTGILINLPSNDVADGYSLTEIESNFQTIVATADAAGVPVWVATTQPRNLSQAGINEQVQLRDWINATYGSKAIDFWSVVANADGTVNAIYGQGDGIHLNALGHQILFNRVAGAGVLTYICSNMPKQNQAPTVSGSLVSLVLNGSGADVDGTIASYEWAEVSGGAATITTPTEATTSVTNLDPGVHTFRLTVTDNQGATATKDVTVTIDE